MITENEFRLKFTPTHHAMLFAWLSKAVIEQVGTTEGKPIILKAVRKYGEQRGRRMALRVAADGKKTTMLNFLIYSEWEAPEGEMISSTDQKHPHLCTTIQRCCWHTAWQESDLMTYGKLYCQEIDQALIRGFNPELTLDILATQTNDDKPCVFIYRDARLHTINQIRYVFGKRIKPGKTAKMPWSYHTAHLFKTTRELILQELPRTGEIAVETALRYFIEKYGNERADFLLNSLSTDYNVLPTA